MELNPENRALCLICLLPLSSLISLSLSLSFSSSSLSGPLAQVEALREENDSLRCQLDAYRNEVELLKQEQSKAHPPHSEEDTTRQQQLSFLQQALQGMQKVQPVPYHTHTHHTLFLNHDESARPDLNLESDTHIKLDINNPDTQQAFNTCNKIKRLGITVLCLLFNRVLCSECKTPGGDYSNEPLIPTYQG